MTNSVIPNNLPIGEKVVNWRKLCTDYTYAISSSTDPTKTIVWFDSQFSISLNLTKEEFFNLLKCDWSSQHTPS